MVTPRIVLPVLRMKQFPATVVSVGAVPLNAGKAQPLTGLTPLMAASVLLEPSPTTISLASSARPQVYVPEAKKMVSEAVSTGPTPASVSAGHTCVPIRGAPQTNGPASGVLSTNQTNCSFSSVSVTCAVSPPVMV